MSYNTLGDFMKISNTNFNHLWLSMLGVILLAFGIAATLIANLGFGPFDTFMNILMELFGFEQFGNVVFWVQMIVLLFLFVNKNNFKLDNMDFISSLLSITVISETINFAQSVLANVTIPTSIIFTFGIFSIATGIYFITKSNKFVAPLDKFVVSLSVYFNKPFSTIKIIFDTILITLSILFVFGLGLSVPISIYSIILSISPGYIIKFLEKTIAIEFVEPTVINLETSKA